MTGKIPMQGDILDRKQNLEKLLKIMLIQYCL